MKEQVVPGLTPSCVSEVYCPSAALSSSNSSIACDLNEGATADPSVPMSNLELLGNVAFAMSRTDGADDCLGQSVVLSTNAGGVVMAENGAQIPGNSVVYIVPAANAEAAQSFGAMMQQTVEPSAAVVEDMGDTDCEPPSLSSITNTTSLYLTPLHDSYDTLCNVGPVQFSVCNAASGTEEHDHDIASGCIADEPSASIMGTTDSGFDMALDSFLVREPSGV